jgi:hypothetical protein
MGHLVAHCHTVRCYNYNGFGYKSQDCWNTRRYSMRITSNDMERRAWKRDKVEMMEDESIST